MSNAALRFVDVTAYTEGADLSRPTEAFASCAGDMERSVSPAVANVDLRGTTGLQ